MINQALSTEVRNDNLNAWLEAISNAQLSIGGLQPEMTKPLPKRRKIDQTPGMGKECQNKPDDKLSPDRLNNQLIPSTRSGYWRALLNAAGLELHNSITLAIDSDGHMPDEIMGTSIKEPPRPPSIHSQGSIDPGPRRGAAGDYK